MAGRLVPKIRPFDTWLLRHRSRYGAGNVPSSFDEAARESGAGMPVCEFTRMYLFQPVGPEKVRETAETKRRHKLNSGNGLSSQVALRNGPASIEEPGLQIRQPRFESGRGLLAGLGVSAWPASFCVPRPYGGGGRFFVGVT
jgi:hypothetical protein